MFLYIMSIDLKLHWVLEKVINSYISIYIYPIQSLSLRALPSVASLVTRDLGHHKKILHYAKMKRLMRFYDVFHLPGSSSSLPLNTATIS